MAAVHARPYARAAFAVARDVDGVAAWAAMLAEMTRLVTLPEMARVIRTPAADRQALLSVLFELGEGWSGEGRNLLRLLAAERKLALLPKIETLFEALRAEAEHRLAVRVTGAAPLSDEQRTRISEKLAATFEANIELAVTVDPALLGGLVIRVGDLVADGSLSGRLNELAHRLI